MPHDDRSSVVKLADCSTLVTGASTSTNLGLLNTKAIDEVAKREHDLIHGVTAFRC